MAHAIVYSNSRRATRAISSIFFGRVFDIKVNCPGAGKKAKCSTAFGTCIVVRKILVLCIAFFTDGYKHVTHLCEFNYRWLSRLRIATPSQGKKVHIPPPNLGGIKRRSGFSGTRLYNIVCRVPEKSLQPSRLDFLRRYQIMEELQKWKRQINLPLHC